MTTTVCEQVKAFTKHQTFKNLSDRNYIQLNLKRFSYAK